MANLITVGRVLLVFVVIAVWSRDGVFESVWLDLAMVPVLAGAIIMDALDGWAARKLHEESKAGALFDVAGDRIVELTLWTFFAIRRDASGVPLVPYWVPLVIITRTVTTDLIRSVAFGEGKTPFGSDGMHQAWWARQLVASRWSRAAYGVMKAVAWCSLGLFIVWPGMARWAAWGATFRTTVAVLVYATTVFAVVRAIPVIWEGRRYVMPGKAAGKKAPESKPKAS